MNLRAARATAVLGLAVIVIGTFLPWLRSGSTTRNSYQAGAAARQLLDVPRWLGGALLLWPFAGVFCAAVIALYVIDLRRVAAAAAMLLGAATVIVAIGVMTIRGSALLVPAMTGPAVTITGAVAVMVATMVLLLERDDQPGRSRA